MKVSMRKSSHSSSQRNNQPYLPEITLNRDKSFDNLSQKTYHIEDRLDQIYNKQYKKKKT